MNKNSLSGPYCIEKPRLKHFFRIMRISLILLFITIFCMHAENTISQNARVSISQRNVNLQKVMDEIESQTDYLFIYTHGVDVDRKVSLNVKQQPVKDVLNALFEGTNVDYSMTGSHIILSTGEGEGEETTPVQQQQNKKITGIVTDSNGEPIIGANIMEKGTVNGTITDMDGNFSLTVKEGAILVVSYVGYITQRCTGYSFERGFASSGGSCSYSFGY